MIRNKRLAILAMLVLLLAAVFGACETNVRDPEAGAGEGEATTNEPAADDSTDGPIYDAEDQLNLAVSPWMGAADAVVTIVEYSDFECPFCSRVGPTLAQIHETYPDQVRVVFKQLPLPFHDNADLAAQASLAANAQGQFWEYHDILFENQRALTRPDLNRFAEQLGLDMTAFAAALDDGTYAQQVQDEIAEAATHGIRGTPNFLINGRPLTGAQPFDAFNAIILEEIEAMNALIEGGQDLATAFGARLEENLNAPAAAPPTPTDAPPARPTPDPDAEMYIPVGQSPSHGGSEPLVTIMEFSEFQCPYCSRVGPTMAQILETYGDDVAIVFKHRPLGFHDNAEPAALASIAAQNQGQFWEYHDILFANQRALTRPELEGYAEQLGLDMAQFNADMDAPETRARMTEDVELADRVRASGTPHFFINGIRLRGAQPFERFQTVIDAQLEIANAALASGVARADIYTNLQEDAIRGPAPMITPPGSDAPSAPVAAPEPVDIPVGDAPYRGPLDARVTIVEYSDYQCPFCSRFANNLDEALEGIEDQVLVVFKQFPLGFHAQANLAAQASLAAHAQGQFWEYHDLLFANATALMRPDLERYAEQLGLDMAQFNTALDDGTFAAQVTAETAEGGTFGVRGTPSWFVNGVFQSGAQPAPAIRALIDAELAAAE